MLGFSKYGFHFNQVYLYIKYMYYSFITVILIRHYEIVRELCSKIKFLYLRNCYESIINMQEINDNTFLEKQQENIIHKKEGDQIKESSIDDNIQVIKDVKETKREEREDEEINEKVVTFLHEKGLSKNLIKTLINASLTDEHVRLLKTLNLSDDDIDNLQDLWQAKIEVDRSSDSINSTSSSSSSNHYAQLSSNNIYLKEVLSKPLIQALCEIIAKKPIDPVEYLGHWLLHYKICEERAMQQKEHKSQFLINMEKLKLTKVEDKEDLIERKDDEEQGENWN